MDAYQLAIASRSFAAMIVLRCWTLEETIRGGSSSKATSFCSQKQNYESLYQPSKQPWPDPW